MMKIVEVKNMDLTDEKGGCFKGTAIYFVDDKQPECVNCIILIKQNR